MIYFEILRATAVMNSPDQIEPEDWFEHGDIWQLASWLEGDTYYYVGIQLNKLKDLYYA
jgi:hypothetical protein